MTALSIQPPYPIFTEADGSPLENGIAFALGLTSMNIIPGVLALAERWGGPHVIHRYPALYHELFNEPEKAQGLGRERAALEKVVHGLKSLDEGFTGALGQLLPAGA